MPVSLPSFCCGRSSCAGSWAAALSNAPPPGAGSGSRSGFRLLAVGLGGVLIKAGQFLSVRVDVLPRVVTDELSGLQDEVPPESLADIRAVIESEYGRPVEQVFRWFAAPARGGGLAGPGAPCPAADRRGGGGQGAAPAHRDTRRDRSAGHCRPPSAG